MANSRLEKIGTIFSRTTGLLRSGAMKPEDKPIWYDIYANFPPHLEPRYDRPAPNIQIKYLFYEEDKIRARYHTLIKNLPACNLLDTKHSTQTQEFISAYSKIKNQGALDEESIFEAAQEMAKSKFNPKEATRDEIGLVSSFKDAKKTFSETRSVDIKSIFD